MLRVNVMCSAPEPAGGGRFHVDTLDLYSARARVVFAAAGDPAGDPAAALADVTASLDSAVASARRPHQALDAAQNQLTWAAGSQ